MNPLKKDPAFLFYPAEAAEDTQHMNRLERGAYFDLLKAQRRFNNGFSLDQIKKILSRDFDSTWPAIELIMAHEEDLYFIPWVKGAIENRESHRQKQRQNSACRQSSGSSMDDPKHSSGSSMDDPKPSSGSSMDDPLGNGNGIRINTLTDTGIVINPEYRQCSELLMRRILERRKPKISETTLISWDRDVRLMVDRDNRSISDIKILINECHDMEPTKTGFSWRDNILSMGTLRQRWNEGKISIGMTREQHEPGKSGLRSGNRTVNGACGRQGAAARLGEFDEGVVSLTEISDTRNGTGEAIFGGRRPGPA
jgi:hypothetical protein